MAQLQLITATTETHPPTLLSDLIYGATSLCLAFLSALTSAGHSSSRGIGKMFSLGYPQAPSSCPENVYVVSEQLTEGTRVLIHGNSGTQLSPNFGVSILSLGSCGVK